jgi:hypothetical protein
MMEICHFIFTSTVPKLLQALKVWMVQGYNESGIELKSEKSPNKLPKVRTQPCIHLHPNLAPLHLRDSILRMRPHIC